MGRKLRKKERKTKSAEKKLINMEGENAKKRRKISKKWKEKRIKIEDKI